MLRISCTVLAIVLTLNHVATGDRKLIVTVLYESQCPDSRNFIVNQLQPTMQLLQDHIILDLVPFGKADRIGSGFRCQHGPSECAGNLVQSCALDVMTQHSDAEKVDYVACEMTSEAGTRGDMECVRQAGLPEEAVRACISSPRGFRLQLNAERFTKSYNHKFIPTILVNEVFNQRIQDSSLSNLSGTLCNMLPDAEACAYVRRHY